MVAAVTGALSASVAGTALEGAFDVTVLATRTGSYIAEVAVAPQDAALAGDLACSLSGTPSELAAAIYQQLVLSKAALAGHTAAVESVGVCANCDADACLQGSQSTDASASMAGAAAGAAIGALILIVLVVVLVWTRKRDRRKRAGGSTSAIMYPNPLFDPAASRRNTIEGGGSGAAPTPTPVTGMPAPYVLPQSRDAYIDVDDGAFGQPKAPADNYIQCQPDGGPGFSTTDAPEERDYMLPSVDPSAVPDGESYELPVVQPGSRAPMYDQASHGVGGAAYQAIDGGGPAYDQPLSEAQGPTYTQAVNTGHAWGRPVYDLPADQSSGGHSYAEPFRPSSAIYASAGGSARYVPARDARDSQSHLPAGFYDDARAASEPIYECPGETTQSTNALLEKYAEEVDVGRVQVHETLGSGAFGVVQRGELAPKAAASSSAPVMVAIKQLADATLEKDQLAFLQEAAIQAQFRHPNIVALLGVVTVTQPARILLELCEAGELHDLLLTGTHTDEWKLRVAGDVAEVGRGAVGERAGGAGRRAKWASKMGER